MVDLAGESQGFGWWQNGRRVSGYGAEDGGQFADVGFFDGAGFEAEH